MTVPHDLGPGVQAVSGEWLRTKPALVHEIHALASTRYVDPQPLLDRELGRAETVYLGIGSDRRLFAYQTVVRSRPNLLGSRQPTAFFGASAVRDVYQGSGMLSVVWLHAVGDLMAWQRQVRSQVLMWATTATPVIYLAFSWLEGGEPAIDGTYSPRGAFLARELTRALGAEVSRPDPNPFVLRGAAPRTRYSVAERRRIADVCRRRRFGLFEQLGLDETQGDRLLCIGFLPTNKEHALSGLVRQARGGGGRRADAATPV